MRRCETVSASSFACDRKQAPVVETCKYPSGRPTILDAGLSGGRRVRIYYSKYTERYMYEKGSIALVTCLIRTYLKSGVKVSVDFLCRLG